MKVDDLSMVILCYMAVMKGSRLKTSGLMWKENVVNQNS